MCKDGFYYSTRDEEPNEKDIEQKCPFCENPIGSIKEKRRIIPVKRNNYFRILTQDEFDLKKKREFIFSLTDKRLHSLSINCDYFNISRFWN